jgi:selenocysteine lyase/cysteine desulfurase
MPETLIQPDNYSTVEQSIYAALQSYSNVHRGKGQFSQTSSHLYEKARERVLNYAGLASRKYTVIFCSKRRASILVKQLKHKNYQLLTSAEFGLPLGVCALILRKTELPEGIPHETGGGTAKLMARDWIIWSDGPAKYEAGTPAILNVIGFVKALQIIKSGNNQAFLPTKSMNDVSKLLNQDELEYVSGLELLQRVQKSFIGTDTLVPTLSNKQRFVNLDNSASTPTIKAIWETYCAALKLSPSKYSELIKQVKAICSRYLNALPEKYDVFFTSNTTESVNIVSESFKEFLKEETNPVILASISEHSSNDLPWRGIPNAAIKRIPIDKNGFVDIAKLEKLLRIYNGDNGTYEKVKIVAVTGASNVLGVCNDLDQISKLVHKYGARLLVDGAQIIPHRKVDVSSADIDYLAFSGHKMYAPFGAGVLVARKGMLHQSKEKLSEVRQSGEENIAGIAALGKAMLFYERIGFDLIEKEEQHLTKKLLKSLLEFPELQVHGLSDTSHLDFNKKLGVISFHFEKIFAHRVAKELALLGGVGVRSGCHCAHLVVKQILNISPGLEKFQRIIQTLFPKISLPGVVRVSIGLENTEEDIDRFLTTLKQISEKKKHRFSKAITEVEQFVEKAEQKVFSIA